jgi:iron(III) transport system substrate-binding protein
MRDSRLLLGILGACALLALAGCGGDDDAPQVVLYCGVDQDQSQGMAELFEQSSGIDVAYHGETEAMRSVGLPQRLVFEKDRPHADVYWSNEIMHMVHLGRIGVIDTLPRGVAELFPEEFRDPKGRWVAFGARARVFLVNTELLPKEEDHPTSLEDLLNPKYAEMGLVTSMAEPLTGTTYTHAVAMLTEEEEGTKAFLQAVAKAREDGRMKVVSSNGRVMRAVSDSKEKVAFGLTDTDDAWIAIQNGAPVKIVYPDQHRRGSFVIPNTVALVKGRPHPEQAETLLRWLTSEATEEALAKSRSAQMPLRAGVPIPDDGHVKRPGVDFKVAPVDWEAVGANVDRWRDWLTTLFKPD